MFASLGNPDIAAVGIELDGLVVADCSPPSGDGSRPKLMV